MSTIVEILNSIIGLFVDDAFLTIAILAVVAATGTLILSLGVEALLGGGFLLLGSVFVLVASAVRTDQQK